MNIECCGSVLRGVVKVHLPCLFCRLLHALLAYDLQRQVVVGDEVGQGWGRG